MLPSQVWPDQLAARAESAIRRVLADDQPLYEPDQPIGVVAGSGKPAAAAPGAKNGGGDHAPHAQLRHWAFSWFPSRMTPKAASAGSRSSPWT